MREEINEFNPLGPRAALVALLAFLGIGALLVADVLVDAARGADALHLATETGAALLAAAGVIALGRRLRSAGRATRRLRGDLAQARADSARLEAEAGRWRAEAAHAIVGLSAAIDHQFERWSLTAAEREIALLLLKGLSLKEIASVRSTSERTVRQQALAIYRKSGLSGRAELAAFFLEDLLAAGPAD